MTNDDKDLNFWISNASSCEEEISDDNIDLETISPESKKKMKGNKPSPSKIKTRKKRSSQSKISEDDDDYDDVVVIEQPSWSTNQPPGLEGEIMPFQDNYIPPPLKSKESQALEFAVEDIRNDINKMLNADDDDDDTQVSYQTSTPVKKEGDITLIFVFPDNTQEERILQSGQTFLTVFQTLPEKYENCFVQIDGVTYSPKDVLNELLLDYTKVTLTEDQQMESLKGLKKLAFSLPSGEKKKLALDPEMTFKEVLLKLGIPNGKLLDADGIELPLYQKIAQNQDLEDGDQIDVC